MPRILGTTVDSRTVERGEQISLNLKVTTFLGVPGMVLNKGYPTAMVPKDLPTESLQLLRAAYGRGLLTLGDHPIEKEVPKNSLKVLLREVDAAKSPKAMADDFYQISRGQRRIVDQKVNEPMMPSAVLQKMLDHELRGQCRDEFVNWIADLRDQVPGHAPVQEVTEGPVQVKIPKGAPGTGAKTAEQQKNIDGLF